MKMQIANFSGHQTAKVFSILFALGSLPFVLLTSLPFIFGEAPQDAQGNPVSFPFVIVFIFPLFYLIFGYISLRIGCWLYNLMFQFIGGIEFTFEERKDKEIPVD